MIIICKIIALCCLGAIAYQDVTSRLVLAWLLLATAVLLGYIHFLESPVFDVFVREIALNVLILGCIVAIVYTVVRIGFKTAFLNHSMGAGDLMCFLALAIGLPPTTFIVVLAMGSIFALAVFTYGKFQWSWKTVPLAGLLSIFMMFFLLASFWPSAPFKVF